MSSSIPLTIDKMLPLCIDSDEATNNSTLSEPRVCFDINCTYPYGAICDRCTFELGLKELSGLANSAEQNMADWIKDVRENVQKQNRESILVDDIGERVTSPTGGTLDVLSDPQAMLSDKEKSLGRQTEAKQELTTRGRIHPALGKSDYLSSGLFEKWLIELFENVHEARLLGEVFVGAAENGYPTENGCPLCSAPLGDPQDQHSLRCRYAHEEQAILRTLFERQKIVGPGKET